MACKHSLKLFVGGLLLLGYIQLKEALAAFTRAARLDPDNWRAHRGRSEALQLLGFHKKALAAVDRAVSIEPRNADTHLVRCIALHGMGRLGEAGAALGEARRLEPGSKSAAMVADALGIKAGRARGGNGGVSAALRRPAAARKSPRRAGGGGKGGGAGGPGADSRTGWIDGRGPSGWRTRRHFAGR